MTITESSTIIPNTTISAANVTVLSSIPVRNINPKHTAMQTGTPVELTNAVLRGNSTNITKITTIIENTKSRKNDITEIEEISLPLRVYADEDIGNPFVDETFELTPGAE